MLNIGKETESTTYANWHKPHMPRDQGMKTPRFCCPRGEAGCAQAPGRRPGVHLRSDLRRGVSTRGGAPFPPVVSTARLRGEGHRARRRESAVRFHELPRREPQKSSTRRSPKLGTPCREHAEGPGTKTRETFSNVWPSARKTGRPSEVLTGRRRLKLGGVGNKTRPGT